MFGWDDAAMIALPIITGAMAGKSKKLDVSGINNKFLNMRPEGWLNEQDFASAERFRNRGRATMAGAYGDERSRAIGRSASRRGGSGALDRNLARLTDMEASKAADINAGAEDQLYRTRMGREGMQNAKINQAWGSELGAARTNFDAGQAQDANFWNSILEAAPAVMDTFSKSRMPKIGAGSSSAGGYPTARPDSGSGWGQGTPRLRSVEAM
jgi:hypothetical protein